MLRMFFVAVLFVCSMPSWWLASNTRCGSGKSAGDATFVVGIITAAKASPYGASHATLIDRMTPTTAKRSQLLPRKRAADRYTDENPRVPEVTVCYYAELTAYYYDAQYSLNNVARQ